jgi:hypothetical protein
MLQFADLGAGSLIFLVECGALAAESLVPGLLLSDYPDEALGIVVESQVFNRTTFIVDDLV